MTIEIETPNGAINYDIQVLKSQNYTIDEIFDKKLLFLIPFHIFSHEKLFEEYENDTDILHNAIIYRTALVKRIWLALCSQVTWEF